MVILLCELWSGHGETTFVMKIKGSSALFIVV